MSDETTTRTTPHFAVADEAWPPRSPSRFGKSSLPMHLMLRNQRLFNYELLKPSTTDLRRMTETMVFIFTVEDILRSPAVRPPYPVFFRNCAKESAAQDVRIVESPANLQVHLVDRQTALEAARTTNLVYTGDRVAPRGIRLGVDSNGSQVHFDPWNLPRR